MSVMSTVYNAITTDATMSSLIGDRMYWGNASGVTTYPILSYFTVDENGDYAMSGGPGVIQEAEEVTIQIDIIVEQGDILNTDAIKSRLKVVMNGIGFRQLTGPDAYDNSTKLHTRATRWVLTNVSDF